MSTLTEKFKNLGASMLGSAKTNTSSGEKTENSVLSDDENNKMREELMKKRGELEKYENEINTKSISAQNNMKLFTEKTIAELFKTLEEDGVDLNSQESINAYLMELENEDPDLRALFEAAMNYVLGEQVPEENLSENINTEPEIQAEQMASEEGAEQPMM